MRQAKRLPKQQPPPVQRIRLRYTKQGRARYASHQDFARAFERALRRADVPMAYSSGFTPHPRISYQNAVPTSVMSLAEYLEIGLQAPVDPDTLQDSLNAVLPAGFQITKAGVAAKTPLTESLTHSLWAIEWETDRLDAAVAALIGSESVVVERMGKRGLGEFDIRPAVVGIEVCAELPGLHAVTMNTTPTLRPADIVKGMQQIEPTLSGSDYVAATRLAQGIWVTGVVLDSLTTEMSIWQAD
ncbi:MAG: TIGR03936 family radical SAM-associated protein [Propionibacteriaceae bacterium]|nr:TIGR03936 family radical SAM-associated protein [Propionibacteriaceae bacterium]